MNFSKHKAEQQKDGTWSIMEIPFFWSGKHHGNNYSEKWLDAAVENFKSLKEKAKRLPRLILGHTAPGVEKKAIGKLDNMKRVGNSLVADLVRITDSVFQEVKNQEWPGRSAETLFEDKRIAALALLGGSEPYFDEIEPIEIFQAEKNSEWIDFGLDGRFEKTIEETIQDRVNRQEQDRQLSDIWWMGKDLIDDVSRDQDMSSEEKQEKAKALLTEMINLLQAEGEKYINTFNKAKGDFKMENLTKEQHEAILEAEKNKGNQAYIDAFQKEHGITPEQAIQKFSEIQKQNQQITDGVRKSAITQFCSNLKEKGMAPALVDAYEKVRIHLNDSDKVEKFSADGGELAVGVYLDEFMKAIFGYAKENKLIITSDEVAQQNFEKPGESAKGDGEKALREEYRANAETFAKQGVSEDDYVKYANR